jgi:hypothetical protein
MRLIGPRPLVWLAAVGACGLAAAQLPRAPGTDRLRDLTRWWKADRRTLLGPHHNLYNPCVLRVPDRRHPYRMWFFGWATGDNNPIRGKPIGDAVYVARSQDLTRWEVYGGKGTGDAERWVASDRPELYEPVVSGLDPGFEGTIAGDPSVVYRRGLYHMAFSSVWFEAHAETQPQHLYVIGCVMPATSRDGIRWDRGRQPILIWDREYEIRMDAAGGTFVRPEKYAGQYHRPSLMWDRDRWRLWFDYLQPGYFASMGHAENRGDFMDPKAWRVTRSGDDPVLADWVNPSVVKAGGRYYSFSDAAGYAPVYGGDGRLITVAVSRDGLSWRILGHVRPEGMAASHVPEAFLEGGVLRVFYSWKPETVAERPWDYRYKEIRAMSISVRDLRRMAAPPAPVAP